nr:hypothetical protein [Tessaracoccus coleopterorum]
MGKAHLSSHHGGVSSAARVCEFIVRGLLPTQDAGNTRLATWVSDDAMSSLFERFLREYYLFHHPGLRPKAATVSWDYEEHGARGTSQLPSMRTDVTLRGYRRTLIIDAKYYSNSMQHFRDKRSIHSGHLYQMLAYTQNADVSRDGSVSGLLLYARTDEGEHPELDVVIRGNRIGARTLDLNLPWNDLSTQLEDILNWL